MSVKIIESFIKGKKNNKELCEDGLVITENYISIIDGVTSKGNTLWQNMTSGVYVKKLLINAINNMSPNLNAEDSILYLNTLIKEEYEKSNMYEYVKEHPEERLQANLIVFNISKNEIWMWGDCQALINKKLYHKEKKIDKILSEARSLFVDLELKNGKTVKDIIKNDTGRKYILPLLKQSIVYNNTIGEYGCNVLDGFEIMPKSVIKIKVKENDEIVLASDGYPVLKNSLKESEEKLLEILDKDPLLINIYKSTKGLQQGNISYDDRTYIKFVVK
jgi:hypothetical protein